MTRRSRLLLMAVLLGAAVLMGGVASSQTATAANRHKAKNKVHVSLAGIPKGHKLAKPKSKGNDWLIPVGGGKTIQWRKGQPLHVAYLTIGSSNDYLVEENKAVATEVKKVGGTVTTYDANFDAPTQIDQFRTVLSSHNYNAVIVNPVDPQLECNLISKSAPKENLLVSVIVGPACDRAAANGDRTWVSGTLNFVGGDAQPAVLKAYFEHVVRNEPGTQNVALFVGPQDNPPSINAVNALKAVASHFANFNIIATYYTDYSSAQGYTDAQDLVQSHPDTTMVITSYSEITVGVVAALKQSGMLQKVKVIDKGGDVWDMQQVKDGHIQMDLPQYPVSNGRTAVMALYLATQGHAVPRYLGNDGHKASKNQLYLTPQDVRHFKAEYKG